MRRVRRGAVAAALAVAVAALIAGPASPADAGSSGRIKARVAKQASGPYEIQVLRNIGAGRAKRFFIKVKNNTPDEPFDVNMTDLVTDLDYKQRYFRNGNNISAAVHGTGYEFHLDAQQVKRFELKIKAPAVSPGPACAYTDLEELGGGSGDGQIRVGVNGSDCD